mgnify:CR=1 FL=1
MYETLEHWKQYKQKKYPTMNELLEMGYTKPGAMILDEMKNAEEYDKALDELATKEMSHKEFDKQLDEIAIKYGFKL